MLLAPPSVRPIRSALTALVALTATVSSACSSTGSGGGLPTGDLGPKGDAGQQEGGANGNPAPMTPRLMAVEITPASVVLEAVNGERPEQDFDVVGTYSDGHTQPVTAGEFSMDRQAIGTLGSSTGEFVASGVAGGQATVSVEVVEDGQVLTAEASLTVTLRHSLDAADLPANVDSIFAQPAVEDEDRAARLVYPLQDALMPQNVFPADIQWLRGQEGDLFEVTLEKPHASVRARLTHTGAGFGNHYLVDRAAWRALAQTDPASDVTVRVQRYDAAAQELIQASQSVNFSFAQAALTGSVYYWDIEAGRIMRIDDGTNERVNFMPAPQQGCVGCHAVSPSGRYMAGRLGGGNNYGTVFDLTTDLSGSPPPAEFNPAYTKWWFSSWAPDETRMVVARGPNNGPSLALIDPTTGLDVAVSGQMPSDATQPDWAPDGSAIAYVADAGQWGSNAIKGNIAVLPVTGPDQVGATQTVHLASDLMMDVPGGNADSYPSWSPDSATVTFTHGTGARSDTHLGALYLMDRDGSNVRRLDNASGGPDTGDSYQSRFSPFDTGEHFWISFLSRRDYGNAAAGTRGKNLQQIWVAAIRKNAGPDEDPSAVAYWLPGQSTASKNISAYWAPRACRQDGESCTVGSECCGGDCRPDADGALVCAPPPPEECRQLGQTCGSTGDCCDPEASCVERVCELPPVEIL